MSEPAWVALGAAPAPALGYGTSLPASPVDGQEYVLVDSLTAPTYAWRFRYNASSTSPYKWEFVGGPARFISQVGGGLTTSLSYVLLTGGPSVVLPNAGDYDWEIGSQVTGTAAQVNTFITAGISAAVGDDYSAIWNPPAASIPFTTMRFGRLLAAPAGSTLAAYVRVGGGEGNWQRTYLKVWPIRVA